MIECVKAEVEMEDVEDLVGGCGDGGSGEEACGRIFEVCSWRSR